MLMVAHTTSLKAPSNGLGLAVFAHLVREVWRLAEEPDPHTEDIEVMLKREPYPGAVQEVLTALSKKMAVAER